MPSYLVEVYLPRSRGDDARASGLRARAAAESLSRAGVPISYVRTTFLPDDETCFHLFEASSQEAVEDASRRAELGRIRVVRAIEASRPATRGSGFAPPEGVLEAPPGEGDTGEQVGMDEPG